MKRRKLGRAHVSGPNRQNMAEEEGFDFVEYEDGTCWHALVCYTRNVETKGFTISPHRHCLPMNFNFPYFV
jgi:hypothetical protein